MISFRQSHHTSERCPSTNCAQRLLVLFSFLVRAKISFFPNKAILIRAVLPARASRWGNPAKPRGSSQKSTRIRPSKKRKAYSSERIRPYCA